MVALVYTFWAVIVLGYPLMWMMASVRVVAGPPRWLLFADPFYLAFAPYIAPGSAEPADFVRFIALALAASSVLVLVAVWRMRPVLCAALTRTRKRKSSPRWPGRHAGFLVRRWTRARFFGGNGTERGHRDG